MKRIEDFFLWRLLLKLERAILVICSVAAIGTVVVSVVLRYVFKSDLYGIEEIITVIAMWLYFLGGVYGSYENSHIRADILSVYVKSEKKMRIVRILSLAVSAGASLMLAKWGLDYLRWSIAIGGETVSLHIPMILSRIPLTICFVFMAVYSIYHLILALLGREPAIETSGGEKTWS
ncbi:TRAP transporter small permease [Bacilliculturomica massiliensis]|uniref:TRAP transporter small permease n=1 Tax=Bacilliculturomica massiliensis TaxID=1917867 RepID=UPI001031C8FF|nr:TRAP transporter small permease subunit [Bacilliculturomica massiliensis]